MRAELAALRTTVTAISSAAASADASAAAAPVVGAPPPQMAQQQLVAGQGQAAGGSLQARTRNLLLVPLRYFCCKFRDFSWNSAAGINALKVCRLLTPRRLHELHIDVSEGSITGFWPPPARSLANRRTIRGLEMEK